MFGDKMSATTLSLILCLLLVGCGSQQVQYVNADDPALVTKLGLTGEDWLHIKQLASERKEFVIMAVGRVAPSVIEIEFKKPDDTRNNQGGPLARLEKQGERWVTQTNFSGDWWAARGRENK
jgi:hypothetical protein